MKTCDQDRVKSLEWCHGQALLDDPDFFASVLPLLADLACPSLLIRGAFDPVTSDLEVRAYAARPETRFVAAEQSAHFVNSEQPDLYGHLVVTHLGKRIPRDQRR